MAGKKVQNITFEKALARLSEIAQTLEQGSKGLEESLKLYEEAENLRKKCDDFLSSMELKIKDIESSSNA